MKVLALATLVLGLASSAYAGSAPAKSYVFKVDFRPLDGPVHVISILPDQDGAYSANHVLTTSGFGAPATTSENLLGERLACVETISDKVLTNLTCSLDNRPVDGQLTEVILNLDESGKYSATRHTSYYNRIEGRVVDEVTEITHGLDLLRDPPKAYKFEFDARPVDGNLVQVLLKKAKDGSYTAYKIVTTAGFGFPVKTTKTKLGSSLVCVETLNDQVLESLICSLDMRPADGYLTEVIATRDEAGLYAVVLHKAAYSMIGGKDFDETTEVADRLELLK